MHKILWLTNVATVPRTSLYISCVAIQHWLFPFNMKLFFPSDIPREKKRGVFHCVLLSRDQQEAKCFFRACSTSQPWFSTWKHLKGQSTPVKNIRGPLKISRPWILYQPVSETLADKTKHMEKHMVYRIRAKPESTAELICQLTLLPPVVSNKSLAKFIVVAYYHIPSGIHSKRQFHISMKRYTEYSNAWSEESSGVSFSNRHSFFVFVQGSNVGLHINHRILDIIANMRHCYWKLLLLPYF